MEKKLSIWNVLIWSLFLLYLIGVASLYHYTHQDVEINFATMMVLLIVLMLNLFNGLWILRNYLRETTLSFSLLIISISFIVMGYNQSMPSFIQRMMILLISYFPVIFLYFFIQFVSKKKYAIKEYKEKILYQFLISSFREILIILNLTSWSNYIFFINLIFLMISCFFIYKHEREDSTLLWEAIAVRRILIISFFSIAPFIFLSLIPMLVKEEINNLVSLMFVIMLPLTLADLMSKNKLIIHRYWKVPFVLSFIIGLCLFLVIGLLLKFVLLSSLMEIVVISHYFLFIGYALYLSMVLYTEYRKGRIEDQLNEFYEERNKLLLSESVNRVIIKLLTEYTNYWGKIWNIEDVSVLEIKGKGSYAPIKESKNIDLSLINNYTLNNSSNIICSIIKDEIKYVVLVWREDVFSEEEKVEILETINTLGEILTQYNRSLKLRSDLDDRPYTALEKSVYMREMKLSNLYHNMVSRYLHDEIQQDILSLQKVSYTTNSIDHLRRRIEEVVQEVDESIKLKTIEWGGYPPDERDILDLFRELQKSLQYQFARLLNINWIVDSDRFREEDIWMKSTLYRFVKELIINTFKHAEGMNATVQLKKRNGIWVLLYEDDGIGIDTHEGIYDNRFGLASILRETNSLGGEMNIITEREKGFRVEIFLPDTQVND